MVATRLRASSATVKAAACVGAAADAAAAGDSGSPFGSPFEFLALERLLAYAVMVLEGAFGDVQPWLEDCLAALADDTSVAQLEVLRVAEQQLVAFQGRAQAFQRVLLEVLGNDADMAAMYLSDGARHPGRRARNPLALQEVEQLLEAYLQLVDDLVTRASLLLRAVDDSEHILEVRLVRDWGAVVALLRGAGGREQTDDTEQIWDVVHGATRRTLTEHRCLPRSSVSMCGGSNVFCASFLSAAVPHSLPPDSLPQGYSSKPPPRRRASHFHGQHRPWRGFDRHGRIWDEPGAPARHGRPPLLGRLLLGRPRGARRRHGRILWSAPPLGPRCRAPPAGAARAVTVAARRAVGHGGGRSGGRGCRGGGRPGGCAPPVVGPLPFLGRGQRRGRGRCRARQRGSSVHRRTGWMRGWTSPRSRGKRG